MTCRECLQRYSDFLDETMTAGEMARCRAHLERCTSCARYHRVMRNGLELVRALPPVEPSAEFGDRLRHGIYHVRDARPERRRGSALSAGVVAVAALAAVALWGPLPSPATPADAGRQELVSVPEHLGVDWWYPIAASAAFPVPGGEAPQTLSMTFPGPYSPLIIEPPVYGGRLGRAVFASHLHTLE